MKRTFVLVTLASIVVLAPESVWAQGYGGPSLLSRGGNSPGRRGRAPVNFQVYAAARALYETGLITPRLDASGSLPSAVQRGGQVELGAYGAKAWSRKSLGLDYRGDYRQTNIAAFSGTNQAMSLDWQGQPTQRISYFLRQNAGTTNRAFGGFSAPSFVDQDNFGVPLNEVFDSRVYFGQTSGGVSYRQSARQTYRVTGEGFVVKRSSRALIGMQGYRAGADWQRAWSRFMMVGAGYNYIKFEYPRVYGGSEIHTIQGMMERRVNRNLTILARLGMFRANTIGTQQITLSPEVAAILGRSTGVEAFRRIVTSPQATLTATYVLERSRLFGTYNTGVTPGNGVYITSRLNTINGGYSYSGIRRLSLGLSVGYNRSQSIALNLGDYTSFQGGGGFSYSLARHWSLSMQADRRRFTSPAVAGRSGSSATLGLSFSPGSIPLSIW